jgi:hypothetical protein
MFNPITSFRGRKSIQVERMIMDLARHVDVMPTLSIGKSTMNYRPIIGRSNPHRRLRICPCINRGWQTEESPKGRPVRTWVLLSTGGISLSIEAFAILTSQELGCLGRVE